MIRVQSSYFFNLTLFCLIFIVSKQIQTIKKSLTGFYTFFIIKNENGLTLSRKDNLACDNNKSNETT